MSELSDSFHNKTKWLLLIPTELERGFIADSISPSLSVDVEVCGFGPIIPAARTVQLIERHQPDRVLLIGIAGSYNEQLTVGAAYLFLTVACYGVGAGTGNSFQTAEKMGWHHWLDPSSESSIGDTISMTAISSALPYFPESAQLQLLTVCAAAADIQDVEMRRERFPDSVAEDMEGFSVAAACKLCKRPISIIRGISNRAGDRDKKNWKISEAMASAVEMACQMIGSEN
jgi:futalosine hydrolase